MSSEKCVVKQKSKKKKKVCCDCSCTAYIKECLFYSHLSLGLGLQASSR